MTYTVEQLRAHEHRIAGMLGDPDLVGDLLLVGLVFARAVDFGDPPLTEVEKATAAAVYGRARHSIHLHGHADPDELGRYHPTAADHGAARVRDVLRSDIRRYVPNVKKSHRCQRPVKRRGQAAATPAPGINFVPAFTGHLVPPEDVCGRNPDWRGTHPTWLVDPVDGTRHAFAACSRARCKTWLAALAERNRAEVAANPPPTPTANRGGVLARHLDELDWPALYTHLNPKWTPPHETPGWRPPKLQIVLGDSSDPDDGLTVTRRPTLTVIEGGWR